MKTEDYKPKLTAEKTEKHECIMGLARTGDSRFDWQNTPDQHNQQQVGQKKTS